MSEPRDPLIEAIHAAGEVPPAPDREAAFARAMRPVLMPSRRRLNRSVIALFAAALLAVPAAVFAARAAHSPAAVVTPINLEKPDPGSSIQHEADDATVKRASSGSNEHVGSASGTDERSGSTSGSGSSGTDDRSGSTASSGSDDSGPGGGSDGLSTPAPTPVPTLGSTDGSGSSDGGISGSSDGGTSGPH